MVKRRWGATPEERFASLEAEQEGTKDSLKRLEKGQNEIRNEIKEFRSEIRNEIKEFRGEFGNEIKEFRSEIRNDIKELTRKVEELNERTFYIIIVLACFAVAGGMLSFSQIGGIFKGL